MKPISKALLKKISSLKLAKYRKKYNFYMAEGYKLLEEAYKAKVPIEYIVIREDKWEEWRQKFSPTHFPPQVYIAHEKEFARISDLEAPSGVLFVAHAESFGNLQTIPETSPLIVLDHIQDPGNLGTILRTAYWFGIENVLLSEDCADRYNAKVLRASMGAIFYQKFYVYHKPDEAIRILQNKGFRIFVAALGGKSLDKISAPSGNWALVLGNEARGVKEEWLKLKDSIVTIPGKNRFDSLNVAVSAGIFLYHLSGQ